jgi:hypothetical protein
MSYQSTTTTLTSHQAAIEHLPSDPSKVGNFIGSLFAAREKRAAEIARVREEAKISDYEETAQRELGLRRNCLKSMEFWRKEFGRNRYEASVGFTQLLYVASLEGWNEAVEKPEDETPVMDRTRTAQRMRGASRQFGRDGSLASYGATQLTARQREVEASAARCLEKLRNGVPPEKLREGEGAGRPSSAWEEGRQMALAQFFAEIDPVDPDVDPTPNA